MGWGRGLLVQWLKLLAWKIRDHGFIHLSDIRVSKKQYLFLPRSLINIRKYGEPVWPTGSVLKSCVWRAVLSHSSHHPHEVLLAYFSLHGTKLPKPPSIRSFSHTFIQSFINIHLIIIFLYINTEMESSCCNMYFLLSYHSHITSRCIVKGQRERFICNIRLTNKYDNVGLLLDQR